LTDSIDSISAYLELIIRIGKIDPFVIICLSQARGTEADASEDKQQLLPHHGKPYHGSIHSVGFIFIF
jgi:hypothetical protein